MPPPMAEHDDEPDIPQFQVNSVTGMRGKNNSNGYVDSQPRSQLPNI